MYLMLYTLLIIVFTVSTISDYKRIKSNKDLSNNLAERNKLLKENIAIGEKSYEEYVKIKECFEELKINTSLNYDHLAEEVTKRMIEQQKNKEININI